KFFSSRPSACTSRKPTIAAGVAADGGFWAEPGRKKRMANRAPLTRCIEAPESNHTAYTGSSVSTGHSSQEEIPRDADETLRIAAMEEAEAISPPIEPGTLEMPRIVRALRHRNFRYFWIGNFLSNIGTWMQSVAQGWLVLVLASEAPPVVFGSTG